MNVFIKTIKHECTRKLIFFGERSLSNAVGEFIEYYNQERFHQGMDNGLLTPRPPRTAGSITRHERVGGMLNFYERQAA